MAGSTFQMIQSDAFSIHDLCEVQINASHRCMHFNDPRYIEAAVRKSSVCLQMWSFFSLPTCQNHPITHKIKEELEGKKFDLPHMTTMMTEKYQNIPGMRLSEFNRDHKRVTVSFEFNFWATVGQLKLLPEDITNKLSIEVHTAVGKMQI